MLQDSTFYNMWVIVLLVLAVVIGSCDQTNVSCPEPSKATNIAPQLVITSKKFQLGFLKHIGELIDDAAHRVLSDDLKQLQRDDEHAQIYNFEFEKMNEPIAKLDAKIIFIKQLLDLKNDHHTNIDEKQFYTLRNVNFLKKLKQRMDEFYDETGSDLRLLRMYALCRQFEEMTQKVTSTPSINEGQAPYSSHTKLSPLKEEEQAIHRTNITLDINTFGRKLYDNVKIMGAELIDEFLYNLRKLLNEVIDEKPEKMQQVVKLNKFVKEINIILNTKDFYEKRQALYTYLKNDLAADFEQLQQQQDDLENIFTKLRERGLNVFVAFLFSNFEFLDHLHTEWYKLLPVPVQQEPFEYIKYYHDDVQLLANISRLYVEFKRDNENEVKYEAYMEQVKKLQQMNLRAKEYLPIFELLHNSSLNVGIVTMSIIRGKCEET